MRFTTVLNELVYYKGFSFDDEVLNRKTKTMIVQICSRKGSLVSCPECGQRCTVYDHQPARRYDFEPYMDMKGEVRICAHGAERRDVLQRVVTLLDMDIGPVNQGLWLSWSSAT